MKKISILLSGLAMLAFTSCDDFLDSENYTEANMSNYPASPSDLNTELAALYGVMNQFSTDPLQSPWFVYHIMSDDANGAGGTGDVEAHAIGHLTTSKESLYDNAWHATFVGISRANSIIYAVDAFDWTGNESTRSQLLGEAYFMRGLFYLWGVQFWGDIPAYWSAAAPDPCPQQSAEEVIFPHILADFVSAMNLMQHGATTQGDGHATKGAAEGYLARAYMFYQGFYKKAGELANASLAEVELPEQEGVKGNLSKQQVIDALMDCINNSGNKLVEDYRLLWQYTNTYTAPDYAYVKDLADAGQFWAGNGNAEQLFQVQFGAMASWNGTIGIGFANSASLYCGLRCDDNGVFANGGVETRPFGQGWGQGTCNYNSVSEWPDVDPRKKASILDCEAELLDFAYTTSCSEETGYYNKKWLPVTCSKSGDTSSDNYTWWGVYRTEQGLSTSGMSSFQGDHYADMILMRLSDIMLMHTELTGDATQMNKVRARAGLANESYSWTNIQNERRWELYGEGLRFNDLRRWSGKDGGTGCFAAVALEKQNGSKVNYTGRWTTMHHGTSSWAQRYAETDGFLPIPPAQIRNVGDESVLKQNKGWGSDVNDWNLSGTPIY